MNVVAASPKSRSRRWSVGRPPEHPVAGRSSRPAGAPLRVAMLAPPWISVPPPGYGGVESVVGVLTDALVRRGHAVTLFCAPGSRSSARVVPLLDESHPEAIERSLYEVDHVARAFEEIDLAAYDEPGQQTFFDREVAPHVDGERVRFIGEIGGAVKLAAFAGARALLMPIRWEEPFGMVMVEALACGTPVIAFAEGAARELVCDGQTGFLVEDEQAMGAAVGRLPHISPRDCRAWVAEHCDVDVVAAAYEQTYRSVAHARVAEAAALV